jgi:Aspartate/tyrosine/aromatic aminotransferase
MIAPVAELETPGEDKAFAVLTRAAELAAAGRDIVDLGCGTPGFRTPRFAAEAAAKAARDGRRDETPTLGLPSAREAVACRIHATIGVQVSPDRVVVTPGAKPALYAAILFRGEPGAEILHPDPGSPVYRALIELTGARAIPVPMREENGFAFSAEETLSLISRDTRLLILNSPANPTGAVTSRLEIEKLVAGLADHPEIAILSDETFAALPTGGERATSLLEFPEIADRLIVVDGWSRSWGMSGWRLGWSVWPENLLTAVRRLAANTWTGANAATQEAGIAAMEEAQEMVAATAEALDRRRRLVAELADRLPDVSCLIPAGAVYAFPNIKATGWKSRPLARALLDEAGVAVVGGAEFGEHGEGYLRISCACPEEDILSAFRRIGAFLKTHEAEERKGGFRRP